jgi:predicted phage terminase large subunit-like protein
MTAAMRSIPERSELLMSRTMLRRCRRRFADLGWDDAFLCRMRALLGRTRDLFWGGMRRGQTGSTGAIPTTKRTNGAIVRATASDRRGEQQLKRFNRKDRALSCRPTPGFLIFSVCTTWIVARHRQLFLVDVYRARLDYPSLKSAAVTLASKFRAHRVLIEDMGAGTSLAQELQQMISGAVPVKPDRDKVSRMAVASAEFEAGHVLLPRRAWRRQQGML